MISPTLRMDPTHGRTVVDKLAQQAGERLRSISSSRPFVAFVIIAALALGLYYFILAAPIYISQTSLQLRGREQPSAAVSGLLSALGGGGGGGGSGVSSTDVAAMLEYIDSYDMAAKLDQRFHLRAIYSKPRADFLNWMPSDASKEDYLAFYRKMVKAGLDHDNDLITIQVKAFDPVLAQQMAGAIVSISSDYVNGLSGAIHKETTRASERELREAEEAAREAHLAVTAYRARTGMIDPLASATSTSAGVAAMQQEIVQTRAEMTQMMAVYTSSSPEVAQERARITGLQQQIDAQQKQVANTDASDNIAQRLREYENLMINSDYADRQIVAALASYDAAKSLARERERFLVQVIPPDLAETPAEPHRLLQFTESLIVLIALYGIVALAVAGVRDHQGI